MNANQRALCLRTADKLTPHDIVRFPDMDAVEHVLRVHSVDTGYIVRTVENIHHCRADYLFEVIASELADDEIGR